MQKKTVLKVAVDIVMTLIFTALMFVSKTGLTFHEIMGLSIIVLFAVHLALNSKWIISSTKKLFAGKLTEKYMFSYFINVSLFIGIIGLTITGILISAVLFPSDLYSPVIKTLHKWVAYITAGLIALHILMHLKYLISVFSSELRTPLKTLGNALALLITTGIIYYNIITITENRFQARLQSDNDIAVTDEKIIEQEEPEIKTNSEIITQTQPEAVPTLAEFLGKMFCTNCPKHCPLSSPKCRKSDTLIQEAKKEYQELYENSSN